MMMKKTAVVIFGVLSLFFSVVTNGAETTVVDLSLEQETSLPQEVLAFQVKQFTDRFYHAAEIVGISSFTPTEKQHIEAAIAGYLNAAFQVYRKHHAIPLVVKISKDPTAKEFQQKMLKSQDRNDLLAAARGYAEYIRENYPDLVSPGVIADLQQSRMKLYRKIEEVPSMPRPLGKYTYNFWSSTLTPGVR